MARFRQAVGPKLAPAHGKMGTPHIGSGKGSVRLGSRSCADVIRHQRVLPVRTSDTDMPVCYSFRVRSATAITEQVRQFKNEIEAIELANREYRGLKNPGYPAQRLDEERRIRLVQIQEELKALMRR